MTEAGWAIVGVVIGIVGTVITNSISQSRQFKQERDMYRLQNESSEKVKAVLQEMLNHKTYTDRSFSALRERVGGFSDDEVRQFLHAIGARRTTRQNGEEEWWYLESRQEERIAKRSSSSRA